MSTCHRKCERENVWKHFCECFYRLSLDRTLRGLPMGRPQRDDQCESTKQEPQHFFAKFSFIRHFSDAKHSRLWWCSVLMCSITQSRTGNESMKGNVIGAHLQQCGNVEWLDSVVVDRNFVYEPAVGSERENHQSSHPVWLGFCALSSPNSKYVTCK